MLLSTTVASKLRNNHPDRCDKALRQTINAQITTVAGACSPLFSDNNHYIESIIQTEEPEIICVQQGTMHDSHAG